ncbi:MAG TPA: hypothetical protein PLS49_07250 [Candidatus Woesebacteria bacterium]|nr:hypothetical protein [Candidatus Woesebacteria bacterium]
MKQVFSILLLLILFLYVPSIIVAQSFSIELGPKQQEIITQRNKTITIPYTITNYADPQVLNLSIYTLSVLDNEGNYDLTPYKNDDTGIHFKILGNTVALDSPFLLKSKNTLDFNLEITIPAEIQETDYTFSLVAQIEPQKGFENTNTILLQGGIASNIILSVTDSGNLDQKGNIIQYEFLTDKILNWGNKKIALLNSYQEIPVLLMASNNGNNAVKTSGSITLLSNNKEKRIERASFTIPPQYIFAGSQRLLKTSDTYCENNLNSVCKKTHSVVIKSPFMGLYNVAAVVSFGENAQISYNTITFLVLPITYLSIFLIFIIVFLIFLPTLRRYIK